MMGLKMIRGVLVTGRSEARRKEERKKWQSNKSGISRSNSFECYGASKPVAILRKDGFEQALSIL